MEQRPVVDDSQPGAPAGAGPLAPAEPPAAAPEPSLSDAGERSDPAGAGVPGDPDGGEDPGRGRGARLGRSAAERTGGLGRTAAGKTGEIGRAARGKTGEFGRIAATKSAELGRTVARLDVPWARGPAAGLVREGIHELAVRPVIDYYTRSRGHGVERLAGLRPPVIFVANHSSHLDAPTILRALPRRWRQRTAVAAAADYFSRTRAVANAFALIFNTVPLVRRGGGVGRGSTDHVDQLIDERWNLLMFPEGTRSRDGRIGKLRTGAAVIAARHGIPIVPIYVKGTWQAMPPGRNWPRRMPGRFVSRRHRVDISFGDPILAAGVADREAVMERVRDFFVEHADPEPPTLETREPLMFRRYA